MKKRFNQTINPLHNQPHTSFFHVTAISAVVEKVMGHGPSKKKAQPVVRVYSVRWAMPAAQKKLYSKVQ